MTTHRVAEIVAAVAVSAVVTAPLATAAVAPYRVALPCEASRVIPARAADRMLVSCRDRSLHAVALPDGRVLRSWPAASFPADAGQRLDAAISDDGRNVAIAFFGGKVIVSSVDDDTTGRSLQLEFYPSFIRFDPSGTALWAGRKRIQLRPNSGVEGSIPVAFDNLNDIAFAPDGRTLATANADTTLHIYDARSLAPLAAYTDLMVEPLVLTYLPHGRSLVVGVADGRLLVFDPRNMQRRSIFETPAGTYPTSVVPVSKTLVAVSYGPVEGGPGRLAMLDVSTGTLTAVESGNSAQTIAMRRGKPWAFGVDGSVATFAPLGSAPRERM